MAEVYNWTRLEEDWGRVRDWAREKGATSFATVGNYHTKVLHKLA